MTQSDIRVLVTTELQNRISQLLPPGITSKYQTILRNDPDKNESLLSIAAFERLIIVTICSTEATITNYNLLYYKANRLVPSCTYQIADPGFIDNVVTTVINLTRSSRSQK